MICYRDRCYCMNETCKRYKKCKNSFWYARKEQAEHKDVFVRCLPIDVMDMSKHCEEYEVAE